MKHLMDFATAGEIQLVGNLAYVVMNEEIIEEALGQLLRCLTRNPALSVRLKFEEDPGSRIEGNILYVFISLICHP